MKEYCYVILNVQGISYRILESGQMTPTIMNILPQLLRDGWYPERETAMGGVGSSSERPNGAFSLILLSRVRSDSGAQPS